MIRKTQASSNQTYLHRGPTVRANKKNQIDKFAIKNL